MSVGVLGVCQSRNWEAFSVDLWGQGLPKAALQNNSRPGSWQWDPGGCCSAGLSLSLLAITSPIWSVWNVAMLYCMWTDTFVMSDTVPGRWEGSANSSLIPTLWTAIKLFTVWRVTCIIRIVPVNSYDLDVLEYYEGFLCICQHWMFRRGRTKYFLCLLQVGEEVLSSTCIFSSILIWQVTATTNKR